jgi:hypothetical protein
MGFLSGVLDPVGSGLHWAQFTRGKKTGLRKSVISGKLSPATDHEFSR